jgi:FixJ family two-component response regulator
MRKKGRARYGDHKGAKNANAKMNEVEATQVIQGILDGRTNKAIAADAGVSHSMVSRIRVGRSWRQLSERMGYEPKPSKLAPKSGRTKAKLHG